MEARSTTDTGTLDQRGRYHISLSADSWIIRWYVKVYEANPNNINTCKLFWAYVFMIPALLLIGFAKAAEFVVVPIADRYNDWKYSRRKNKPITVAPPPPQPIPIENLPPPGPKPKSAREEWLERISAFLGMAWYKLQKPLTVIAGIIGLAIVVGIVGLVVLAFIKDFWGVLTAIGIMVGIVLLAIAAIALIAYLDQSGKAKRAGNGIKSFGRTMKRCFHAFHDHTCAIVDIKEDTSENSPASTA